MIEDLQSEISVALGSARAIIIEDDRLPMTWSFGQANVSRDDRLEDLRAQEIAQIGHDLVREIGAFVVHGEEEAFDLKPRVELSSNSDECIPEFGDTFQGVIFALDRHKDGVGGRQGVECEKSERWGTVDEDEVEVLANGIQSFAEAVLAPLNIHQFDFGSGEVPLRWDEPERRELRRQDQISDRLAEDKGVVDGFPNGAASNPESGSGVGLRIKIHEQHAAFERGERG
jgi:hypothetical protein